MNEMEEVSEPKNKEAASVSSGSPNSAKKENVFLNMGFNILLPILILNKGDQFLGDWLSSYFENTAVPILLIALLFPISYFFYDLITRKKYNFISILGLISVLLTGGIGILEIPTEWFAVKEAAIPALIGLAVIVSLRTPYPLVRTFLLNPELMDVEKIDAALAEKDCRGAFDQLLVRCTYWLGFSFVFSAVLNFVLARWIVVSPSGTDAYNEEVARMMLWSWPVIAIPCLVITMYALWLLLKGIQDLTGYKLESFIRADQTEK